MKQRDFKFLLIIWLVPAAYLLLFKMPDTPEYVKVTSEIESKKEETIIHKVHTTEDGIVVTEEEPEDVNLLILANGDEINVNQHLYNNLEVGDDYTYKKEKSLEED